MSNHAEYPEVKIVGAGAKEHKEELRKEFRQSFQEGHYLSNPENWKLINERELDKIPAQQAAIALANEIVNRVLEEAGVTPFDVPEQNIHLVSDDIFKLIDGEENEAITLLQEQAIVIKHSAAARNPIEFSSIVLHERSHLAEYLLLQAIEGKTDKSWEEAVRRQGLRTSTFADRSEKRNSFESFSGLVEAVVSEVEKRYLKEMIARNPYLQEEHEWLASAPAQQFIKETVQRGEAGRGAEEIMWISRDGKENSIYSYFQHRQVLDFLAQTITGDQPELSKEAVKSLFIRANFSGRLLELTNLVESSFRTGTFRVLGMMDDNDNSALRMLDYLRKERRLVVAEREKQETSKR